MGALSKKLRNAHPDRLHFWCPGCDEIHGISIAPGAWTWNGDAEHPTFSPSVLVTGGAQNGRCHSFVRDGNIQFLGDCTHALAGQTVPLPEWTELDE